MRLRYGPPMSWTSRAGAVYAGVGFVAVAACAPSPVTDADGYVAAARRDVPSASVYGDGELLTAAEEICVEAPATEPGARLLADEYADIAPEDREQLIYLVITVACP